MKNLFKRTSTEVNPKTEQERLEAEAQTAEKYLKEFVSELNDLTSGNADVAGIHVTQDYYARDDVPRYPDTAKIPFTIPGSDKKFVAHYHFRSYLSACRRHGRHIKESDYPNVSIDYEVREGSSFNSQRLYSGPCEETDGRALAKLMLQNISRQENNKRKRVAYKETLLKDLTACNL